MTEIEARSAICGLLGIYLIWLAMHETRHGKRAHESKQHNMRILKLESYPNQNDRLKALEEHQEFLQRRIEKLESENPYERLRRIHP